MRRDAHVRGALSSVVVSAVQHLFAPDVRVETLDFAQRVLVPVIVLRDHKLFNPLVPGSAHSLDVAALEMEARKMVQAGQELVVVSGVHNLHDHEHLALAIGRAVQSRGVVKHGRARWRQSQQQKEADAELNVRPYLDSTAILNELHQSADLLASGLVGLQDPSLQSTFFNPHLPDPTVRKRGTRSHGTRVVPVFLLSLAGTPPGLLLDSEALVTASQDVVVVLQSLSKNETHMHDEGDISDQGTTLSFVCGQDKVHLRSDEPLRHAVAGLGMALGGLVSPVERHSPLHHRRMESWMWGVGHHPFGPFSNCSKFSAVQLDTAQRNAIYSRVDTALRAVRESLADVEGFTSEYLESPFGGRLGLEFPELTWLDYLYHDTDRPGVPTPLPHNVVAKLEKELAELETSFVRLGELLYDNDLTQAHVLSDSVLITVQAFRQYVSEELHAARAALRCCSVVHKPPPSASIAAYVALLVAGVGAYGLVIVHARATAGQRRF